MPEKIKIALLVVGAAYFFFIVFIVGDTHGWNGHYNFQRQLECEAKSVSSLPAWCLKYLK